MFNLFSNPGTGHFGKQKFKIKIKHFSRPNKYAYTRYKNVFPFKSIKSTLYIDFNIATGESLRYNKVDENNFTGIIAGTNFRSILFGGYKYLEHLQRRWKYPEQRESIFLLEMIY